MDEAALVSVLDGPRDGLDYPGGNPRRQGATRLTEVPRQGCRLGTAPG